MIQLVFFSADKLGEFARNMQLTARIVNGIALQNGLFGTNGTTPITANDVMVELLRMGSLTPDLLIAIKPADVNTAMKVMKELPGKLSNDDDAKNLEQEYANVRTIMDTTVDFKAFEDVQARADAYKANFEALNPKITASDIDNPISKVHLLISDLQVLIEFLSTGNTSDLDEAVTKVSKFYTVRDAENLLTAYGSVGELVVSLKNLEKDYSFIKVLQAESDAREKLTQTIKQRTAEGVVARNIKAFVDAAKDLVKLETMLKQMLMFAKSRQSIQKTVLKYTTGLPGGITDLEKLSMDVEDTWFLSSVNGTEQLSQNLRKGLSPLDSFKTSVKRVENAWNSLQKNIKSAETVLSLQLKTAEDARTGNDLQSAIDAYKNCRQKFAKAQSRNIKTIEKRITPISDFNSKLKGLQEYEQNTLMTNLATLKKLVDFKGKSDDEKKNAINQMISDFKAGKLSVITDTMDTLKKLVGNMAPLKGILPVFADKSPINNAFSYIIDYYDDVKVSNFKEQIECLRNDVGQKADLLKSKIESIQNIREMKTSVMEEAAEFANGVVKSADNIARVRTTVENAMNGNDTETALLETFSNSMMISQNVGHAARGITNLSKTNKILKKLEPLIGDLQYMSDAATKHQKALSDHYQYLQSIGTLGADLIALIKVINNLMMSLKNFNAISLADNGLIFEAAGHIKSVTKVDFAKCKQAAEELKKKEPSIAAKLDKVVNALVDLEKEKLELDFANSKFSTVPDDLKKIEQFFAQYDLISTETLISIIQAREGLEPVTVLIEKPPQPGKVEKEGVPYFLVIVIVLVRIVLEMWLSSNFQNCSRPWYC